MPTENHNYHNPPHMQTGWHRYTNENFGWFDTDIEIRDTEANLANHTPKAGAFFRATDTGAIYLGTGTQWVAHPLTAAEVTAPLVTLDATTTPPRNPGEARLNDGDLRVHSGGDIRNLSNIGRGSYDSVASIAADYTASPGEIILADASAGPLTVTLPAPESLLLVTVKKVDSSVNAVTVATPGLETIDGQADLSITSQWVTREITSDGTNYFRI